MLPEREIRLNDPPNEVDKVDFRTGPALHSRVDTHKRNAVCLIAQAYKIPADVYIT